MRRLLPLLALIALAACGAETEATAEPVPDLLRLSAPLVGGGEVDLTEYAGRPLLLWFWAPTCSVCRREAPMIAELAARLEGRAAVQGVAWSGDEASFQAFVDEFGFGFPSISDPDGAVFAHFGITGQPAAVFVRADGSITVARGAVEETAIVEALGL